MFKLLFVRKFIVKFFKLINEVMLDLLKTKSGGGCIKKYFEVKKGFNVKRFLDKRVFMKEI